MSSPTVTAGGTPRIGTDENPLIHPVTGERLVHSMAAGSLLILAAGLQHDVTAQEPSQMVLTVHLRHG
jgi:hypothetical protein